MRREVVAEEVVKPAAGAPITPTPTPVYGAPSSPVERRKVGGLALPLGPLPLVPPLDAQLRAVPRSGRFRGGGGSGNVGAVVLRPQPPPLPPPLVAVAILAAPLLSLQRAALAVVAAPQPRRGPASGYDRGQVGVGA